MSFKTKRLLISRIVPKDDPRYKEIQDFFDVIENGTDIQVLRATWGISKLLRHCITAEVSWAGDAEYVWLHSTKEVAMYKLRKEIQVKYPRLREVGVRTHDSPFLPTKAELFLHKTVS